MTFSHLWWGAEILLRLGAHCVRLYYWLWKDAYEALEIAQIRRCQIRIGKMQCNPCYQSNFSSKLIRSIFQFDNASNPAYPTARQRIAKSMQPHSHPPRN
ncbi:hypothetical protein MICAD_1540005 [Microcystis aeruginosa PCC 7941]|nr:hypothetical protein MICAD_1540005 [Microcystis aeruginosa PCC 7941]